MKRCDSNNTTSTVRFYPRSYTYKTLSDAMPDTEFLELYFKIRFIEEESKFTPYAKQKLVDDCLEIYYSKDMSAAMDGFEEILNKPFDYRGSLTYNVMADQERQVDSNYRRD